MRKKLLALLLSLVLCVSLLPVGAMAADSEYGVFVGNTQVTSANAADVLGNGKVSYDAGGNTLRLNSAAVDSIIFNEVSGYANVEFTGTNSVDGSIVSRGRLTLRGDGILNVTHKGEEAMPAVAAQSEMFFEGGTFNILCHSGIAVNALYSINIRSGASVKITQYSDFAAIYVNTGVLSISDGSKLTVEKNTEGTAVQANDLEVSGGELTVTAKGTALDLGYLANISGGKVTMSSETGYAFCGNGSLNIKGSEVNVSSGMEAGDEAYGAVFCDDLNISGGKVTVESQNVYALASYSDVNIHDCVFTANADVAAHSYDGNVNVSNCWLKCSSYEDIDTANNVVFDGTTGTVNGSVNAPNGAEVPANGTLTVPEGSTLTVPEGSTLTVEAGATMTNNGKVVIDGTLDNEGIYYENGETEGLVSGGGQMPNNWVVTLDYGYGDVVKYYNVIKGKNTTLPNADRSGYAFLGWQCGGESYSAGDSVKVDGDMTFTASWASHPDSGTFPGFGGSQGGTTESGQPESKPTEPEPKPETPAVDFSDVAASDWYYEAVEYVCAKGLMDGVAEGSFAPNGTLTRAMVWTILARASGVDTDGGASWYAKAQEWAAAKGISDGENPDAAITREEFVTMLWRLAGEPVYTADLSRVPDAGSISA